MGSGPMAATRAGADAAATRAAAKTAAAKRHRRAVGRGDAHAAAAIITGEGAEAGERRGMAGDSQRWPQVERGELAAVGGRVGGTVHTAGCLLTRTARL